MVYGAACYTVEKEGPADTWVRRSAKGTVGGWPRGEGVVTGMFWLVHWVGEGMGAHCWLELVERTWSGHGLDSRVQE